MKSLASAVLSHESAEVSRQAETVEATCPVCASLCPGPPLYRYTVEQAAAHFCPATRDLDRNGRLQSCIRELWEGNECEVRQCSQCGFAFGYPFVGGNEEFYSILHEQRDYPAWRWDYDVAIREAIEKFDGGKVLDIGAGAGNFLARMAPGWGCYAVEGSETTRGELEDASVIVFRDLADAARLHAGTFQVVTLFQALEHIADFGLVISYCNELLASGGRLVVTVPDGEAMIRQERLTGCHDMPPNHVNKWTADSLSRVLTRNGFECGQVIYEPASWRNIQTNLHLRIAADATEPGSLAAQVYRIGNRPLRVGAMALLAGPALLRMLPYRSQLRSGGAFAMIGVKPG